MAKVLDMPKLSPTMEEGVLSAWHKKEGDAIAVDDLLAEVETDKATMEFRAFDKGTLLKILVGPGSQVKLGQPVAIVGSPGEDVSALAAGAAPSQASPSAASNPPDTINAPPRSPPTESPAPAPPRAAQAAPTPAVSAIGATSAARGVPASVLERTSYPGASAIDEGARRRDGREGRVLASPYVRRMARERGIDLHGAQGSGPGGRVVPIDLDSIGRSAPLARNGMSDAAPALARSTAQAPDEDVRPLSPMRKTIARRLTESKTTVPHFYLSVDVDASELVQLREQINAELAKSEASGGSSAPAAKVSLNDLLVKACAVALVRVPECNASFSPEALIVHKRVDISVAVAIPDGLVTPVVRNADQKSVVAIAGEVRELAARARARKLKPEEMADGTFSISNLGMFGIDAFSAVINPPEGAILAVGQVRDVPVVAGGRIAPGKRLAMTLSCDHRVVDGAVGAAFLAELRKLVERPLRVLLG